MFEFLLSLAISAPFLFLFMIVILIAKSKNPQKNDDCEKSSYDPNTRVFSVGKKTFPRE